MNHLLTPKLDLIFKMLFAKDEELLTDLLRAVLNKRIRSVKVRNPEILPKTVGILHNSPKVVYTFFRSAELTVWH